MAYLGKTPSQAVRSRFYFTASGGETSLAPAQVTGLSFTDANYVDVSLNGVALVSGTDYTATPSTNTISSLSALTASDVVEIVVYDTFSVFGGNVNGDFTISNGTLAAEAVTVTGLTTTGNINFGDSDAARFGAGGDLTINHDGSNSFITDSGTGALYIQGTSGVFIRSADGGENLAGFTDDGAATLYHDNAAKLATTSTGVDITGGFTATDGCTITTADNSQQLSLISTDADANVGPELHLRRNSASPANNDAAGEISFNANNDAGQDTNIVSVDTRILNVADGSEEGGLEIRTMKAGSMRSRINMYGSTTVINDDSQDIDFRVESDNNANAFFVEGSSGRVGIGTSSPSLATASGSASGLEINGSVPAINLNAGSSDEFLIYGGSSNANILVGNNNPLRILTGGSEAMRIDSSGNLLVGTTSYDGSHFNDTSGGGFAVTSAGKIDMKVDGTVANLNRTSSSDGDILYFAKQGSGVGSIGTDNVGDLFIGNDDVGVLFAGGSDYIIPWNPSGPASRDNAISLGDPSHRFKNLELSGSTRSRGTYHVFTGADVLGSTGGITSTGSNPLVIGTDGTERMRIDSSGNVGIGTSSPAATSSTYKNLQVGVGATVIGRTDDTPLYLSSNLSYNSGWKYIANTTATQIALGTNIQFFNVPSGTAGNAATLTERMRVDSSGNLLVGTTDPLVGSGTGNNTEGLALSAGSYGGYATFSRSGSECLNLNRKTNDGTILNFRKDGTTVGGIGGSVGSYGYMHLGSGATGLQFTNAFNQVIPYNPSSLSARDNAIDLGTSSARFKDLYLSGGAYLGGTGSANKLDDYEEGTFTPNFTGSGGGEASYSVREGSYTKVGRLVVAHVLISLSSRNTLNGNVQINSLPFTVATLLSSTSVQASGSVGYFAGLQQAASSMVTYPMNNSTNSQFHFVSGTSGTAMGSLETTHITDNFNFRATVTYFTT